eukprot:351491-Chlamydomonas_euryale.AAC.27
MRDESIQHGQAAAPQIGQCRRRFSSLGRGMLSSSVACTSTGLVTKATRTWRGCMLICTQRRSGRQLTMQRVSRQAAAWCMSLCLGPVALFRTHSQDVALDRVRHE